MSLGTSKNKADTKSSRFYFRILVFFYCFCFYLINIFRRRKPSENPKSFLIAHHLLLGDTLMLTPMLAKLRYFYPDAIIYFLASDQYVDLYEKSPYKITAIGYNPKNFNSYLKLRKIIKSVDIAYIPGDNRFSSLAYSLNAKWIVAFYDRPENWLKNIFVDEFVPIPDEPIKWEDMNLQLIKTNQNQADYDGFYNKKDWLSPAFEPYKRPDCYIILHVGASNPLRYWPSENWFELAVNIENLGYQVIWTASPQERKLIENIDPQNRFLAYANLSLTQLWDLVDHAKLVVCPDTGVSHLAKLTDTPVIVLFGQGSDILFGKGRFYKNHVFYKTIIIEDFPCRDQNLLFKRHITWVRRCNRTTSQCNDNLCMKGISVSEVFDNVLDFTNQYNDIRE